MMIKTYSELIAFESFKDRYQYLKIGGKVGEQTFGHDRYLNQILYTSEEWRRFRREIIVRDNGCDLGCCGFDIRGKIIIHHLEPITVEDVLKRSPKIFDTENVVCVSMMTHNAIHYGDESLLILPPIERKQNDTCPWKRV